MKQLQRIAFLWLVLMVASCSGIKQHAESARSPATSSEANSSTTNAPPSRLCSLFTATEIKELLGASVGDGYVTGPMDSACRWDNARSDESAIYAQIQMMDTDSWEKHTGAQGYAVLHGIGREAFVASALGGWEAGALTDKNVIFVSINGGASSRDTAIRFLRDTLARLSLK